MMAFSGVRPAARMHLRATAMGWKGVVPGLICGVWG